MNWTSGLSTLAAVLTFATFYMHGELKIRAVAMTANVATIVYTAATYLGGTYSIASFFILHLVLLIMNASRIRSLMRCPIKISEPTPSKELLRPASPSGINVHHWNTKGTTSK